jgi:hypothetical protein
VRLDLLDIAKMTKFYEQRKVLRKTCSPPQKHKVLKTDRVLKKLVVLRKLQDA